MIGSFKIRVLESKSEDSIFDISNHHIVKELTPDFGIVNPTIILADPFLYSSGDRLFLFYESKRLFSPGVIKMCSTEDLVHWSDAITVLSEPFHLSFPNVFFDNGKVYMLPEACETGSIRLYVSNDETLSSFRFCKTLVEVPPFNIDETSFVDSTILHWGEKYYLFTTIQKEDVFQLLLYCADNLLGEYKYLQISPLISDNRYGRNAGSIFYHGNDLFRVSQDCSNHYGDNVSIHRITTLSEVDYQEIIVKENLFNRNERFYRNGGHQFNYVRYKGKDIIATDAKEYHSYLVSRIVRKIIRLF